MSEIKNYGDLLVLDHKLTRDLHNESSMLLESIGLDIEEYKKLKEYKQLNIEELPREPIRKFLYKILDRIEIKIRLGMLEKQFATYQSRLAPTIAKYTNELASAFEQRYNQIKDGQFDCEELDVAASILFKNTQIKGDDLTNTLSLLEGLIWYNSTSPMGDVYPSIKKLQSDIYVFGSSTKKTDFKDIDMLTRQTMRLPLEAFGRIARSRIMGDVKIDELKYRGSYSGAEPLGEYSLSMRANVPSFQKGNTDFHMIWSQKPIETIRQPYKEVQVMFKNK